MKGTDPVSAKRPGRPLSFNREQALEAAMRQFWRTGYETTSVAALTDAMGITAPSLYASFGDKESLFLECVAKYTNPGPKPVSALIEEAPSARGAANDLLQFSAQWFTQPDSPLGCLVASAATSGSDGGRKVRAALKQVRQTTQTALANRTERDIREGRLPASTDAQALAALTIAVIQGMSTLARDGADRDALLALAMAAMRAWPACDPWEAAPA